MQHSRRTAVLPLTVAAIALAFANGRWSLSIAAWLAPFFLLLFLDAQPARRGLLIAAPVQLLAFFVNWWGIIPVPGIWYYVVAGSYALIYFIPFVIHRLLAPRLPGSLATLVLPTAWVATELALYRLVTPYGSWVSLAYTQVDQRWLIQLASVTGLSGISFLILWTASVGAWSWRRRDLPARTRRGRLVLAAVLLSVFVWGESRLLLVPRLEPSTRVAGITPSGRLTEALGARLAVTRSEDPASMTELDALADAVNRDLLLRTRLEIAAGAQIVVWSEHAASATPSTEDDLLAEASALAREEGVVLILGLGL